LKLLRRRPDCEQPLGTNFIDIRESSFKQLVNLGALRLADMGNIEVIITSAE